MPDEFNVFEHDFALSATSSYDGDGFLTVGIDQYGDTGADPLELHHPFGFIARPLDPSVDATGTPTNGCTMKVWTEGSRKHGMALGDPGVVPNLAQVGKGSSMQYSSAGSFVRLTGTGVNKGRIDIGTSDATGYDMGLMLDPTAGFSQFSQYGQVKFDATGWHLNTKAGSSIDVGGVYGIPAPASQFSAYIRMTTANVQLLAPVVVLGVKRAVPRSPVALATPLAIVTAAIATAMQALQQAILALAASPSATGAPPSADGAVSAAVVELASAINSLTAASAPAPTGDPIFASATTVSS